MSEKERPEWWPTWDRNAFPPLTFHVQVWEAACEAMFKAVIEHIEALSSNLDAATDEWVMIMHEEWQQLRKEAGLE